MPCSLVVRCWLLVALAGSSTTCLSAAEFIPLGFPTSISHRNDQLRVSESGEVVVGVTPDDDGESNRQLLKWTAESGPVVVLDEVLVGVSINADGSTMVTSRRLPPPWDDGQQLIKITGGLIEEVPDSEVAYRWQAPIISQDGSVIYGERPTGYTRWSDGGPTDVSIHGDDGSVDASGWATSVDGSVLVGGRGPSRDTRAFRWTEGEGTRELPLSEDILQSSDGAVAYGVSSDGRWTVGSVHKFSKRTAQQAIMWDGDVTYQRLIPIDDSWGAVAQDVAIDGRIVVGRLYPTDGVLDFLAGVWTAETGMVPLQDLLAEKYNLGELLRGWTLTGLFDITDDGRFMVGHAFNPRGEDEAFLVDLGATPEGDFDRDGELNADDYDRLLDAVHQGLPLAMFDVTGDGQVDGADRIDWIHRLKRTYFGDANFDGQFNSVDLVAVFQAGEYEDVQVANSRWSTGDWNDDADFTTSDLVLAFQDGGYEQGPRSMTHAVPEPRSLAPILATLVAGLFGNRGRLSQDHRRP